MRPRTVPAAASRKHSTKASRAPFIVNAKPLGLRSGLDPADLNKLADDLEVDALRQNNRRAATA